MPRFQCFLSYNRRDLQLVRQLLQALKQNGVTVWFDLDEMPGQPGQKAMSRGIAASRTVAILVGPEGLGDWQEQELELAYGRYVKRKRPRIVPVFLPGAVALKELPETLGLFAAVDLSEGLHQIDQLVAVLTRRKRSSRLARPKPSRSVEPALKKLPLSIRQSFQGRLSDLRELAEVSTGPARVLYGMGGVGKTRLAVEYAWGSGERHDAAFFAVAETRERLRTDLAGLTGLLGLPASNQEDADRSAVLRWLQGHTDWLLILDRVDDESAASAVVDLLPQLTTGRVLITSRLTNWPPGLERQEVQPFGPGDAESFLLARTAGNRQTAADDPAQALRLAEILQGLPLALEQAGAYIVHNQMSLADYLAAWEQERDNLLAWADELVMQYPRSLAVTFQQAVQRLTPGALAVLRLLAHLAPDPFPLAGLTQDRDGFARALALLDPQPDPGAVRGGIREGVAELAAHSIIRRQEGQLSVHRLVQEAARAHIPPERRADWIDLSLSLVAKSAPANPEDFKSWPEWDRLRPHVVQVSRYAEDWRLMNQLGALLWAKGLYRDAEPWLRRGLELGRLAARPVRIAALASNLGELLRALERFEEAEALLREALALDEARLPGSQASVALRLNNLALLLQDAKKDAEKLDEAESLLRRALALDESGEPPDKAAIARDLGNLSSLLATRGKPEEAEPLLQRALKQEKELWGPDHPNVAFQLNNLAKLRLDAGHPEEAEPLLREAEEIFRRHLGAEHPHTRAVQESLRGLPH